MSLRGEHFGHRTHQRIHRSHEERRKQQLDSVLAYILTLLIPEEGHRPIAALAERRREGIPHAVHQACATGGVRALS